MSDRKAKKHKHTVFCPIDGCKYTSRHWESISNFSISQKNSTYSTKCPKHRVELTKIKSLKFNYLGIFCNFSNLIRYKDMNKKQIPLNQKSCTNSLGRYPRAMETDLFVFFVNFEESDENGQVMMYRKEEGHLELLSDNYFASVGIQEELQEGNETWMSPQMKKERQLQIDEIILPLVREYVELSHKGDLGERFSELEQEIDEYHVCLPEMDVCAFLEHKFNLK